MICSHCGKVLDSEKLMFCVYCGYPLKGEKKGFFAKSEETGVSRAEELAEASMPEMPSLDVPVQTAPMAGAPVVQNAQTMPQMGAVQPMMAGVQPMTSPMGMQQPMQGMPAGISPMGAQPMMQPVAMQGVSAMGMQQPGMPGISPMGTQPMMQDVSGMQNMGYNAMPQMQYGMPQMQYGMPQFAGYDTNGNPLYVQMMPQFMGYDAYGNPVYNMVAVPYMMPSMAGMNGISPMMQTMYQQEQVIDVPQEQIRPADPIPSAPAAQKTMQAASAVQQQSVVMQQPVQQKVQVAQPVQQKMQKAPAVQQPVQSQIQQQPMQAAPNMQQVMQQPMQQKPVMQPVQQQVAPAPVPVMPQHPVQSVQAAALAVQEALDAYQDAQPVAPSPYRSTQITSVYDVPMDAAALMQEDDAKQHGQVPDEKELLDRIFSDKPKNYSMSEGTKPASAVFSINISASEITNVRADEFADSNDAPPPPPISLFSKPGVQINPFSGPAIKETVQEPEPVAAKPSVAQPIPEPVAKPVKKASKPRTEEDANAAKRAAKEQKLAREAREAKEAKEAKEKEQKPAKTAKKKTTTKKAPAKIVSPDEFFEDKPRGSRSNTLSVKELDKLDDDQLAAALSSMNSANSGKKSTRSMKAASKDEMDISNIDVDAVLGVSNSRLPN